jgi:hypothetical protein
VNCKLDLRVEPDTEPAFEARVDAWLFNPPREGDVVPVLYDGADHTKVVVNHDQTALMDAHFASIRARAVARGHDPAAAAAVERAMAASYRDPAQITSAAHDRLRNPFSTPLAPTTIPIAPVAPQDPLDRLAKLGELRDHGVLTEAEFEQQKQKLLAQ